MLSKECENFVCCVIMQYVILLQYFIWYRFRLPWRQMIQAMYR